MPDDTGSVLELVGLVSICCDWVRWKVGPATFVSVCQHVITVTVNIGALVATYLARCQAI